MQEEKCGKEFFEQIPMKILIIKACGENDENPECTSVEKQMELYGIKAEVIEPRTTEEMKAMLVRKDKFDYIYLSSHGSDEGIENIDQTIDLSWEEFGAILCQNDIMGADCILMLSCCRGGLNQVAYALFDACENINYIIGPRQSLTSAEMLIAFNIIFFNLFFKDVDAVIACEKVMKGTDLRFACFDRLEVEMDPGYLMKYVYCFPTQNNIPEKLQIVAPEEIRVRRAELEEKVKYQNNTGQN